MAPGVSMGRVFLDCPGAEVASLCVLKTSEKISQVNARVISQKQEAKFTARLLDQSVNREKNVSVSSSSHSLVEIIS